MQLLQNGKVINIIENTLNYVDPRLMDHGRRVAYLMYKTLTSHNNIDILLEKGHLLHKNHLRDIVILALLHDIGAYKTEEIDNMLSFETVDVWNHSIYGYLFLKHLSPISYLAPIVLFHHGYCKQVNIIHNQQQRALSQLLCLCDRADIYSLLGKGDDDFKDYLCKNRNKKFSGEAIDLFNRANINIENVFEAMGDDCGFNDIFHNSTLTESEVTSFIEMLVFSIEFRSKQTVIHTVGVKSVVTKIAELLKLNDEDVNKLKTSAMLHDLGKVGVPLSILESSHVLSDIDMDVMKRHVEITNSIIKGNVGEEIRRIAVRHHERLDGSGYFMKINEKQLTTLERILAVADIFSALWGSRSYKKPYPKDKVISLLNEMSYNHHYIDSDLVNLVANHYDEIEAGIISDSKPILYTYALINEEYKIVHIDVQSANI